MLRIRTILVPTDRSDCAEHAYAPAAELAAYYGATLRVVHVLEWEPDPSDDANPTMWEDVTHDLHLPPGQEPPHGPIPIEEVDSPIYIPIRKSTPDIGLRTPPAIVLRDYALSHEVDLIVMATHGRRGIRRFLMGSVAEELVRTAECPVFTIPCEARGLGEVVLAPVDFSEGSREALRYAKEIAARRQVALHVLHVVEASTSPPYLVSRVVRPADEVAADARVCLDQFVRETPGPIPDPVMHVVTGAPAYAIRDYATEVGAGIVVVSTRGRRGLDRLIMGSVAERFLRLAPCAVLTIHPSGRSLLTEGAGTP
jgi:nucleotide-binding universal stress UspA family protein